MKTVRLMRDGREIDLDSLRELVQTMTQNEDVSMFAMQWDYFYKQVSMEMSKYLTLDTPGTTLYYDTDSPDQGTWEVIST